MADTMNTMTEAAALALALLMAMGFLLVAVGAVFAAIRPMSNMSLPRGHMPHHINEQAG